MAVQRAKHCDVARSINCYMDRGRVHSCTYEPALSRPGGHWAYVMGAWDERDHHVGLAGVFNHKYRAPVARDRLFL
jgi:hypothetical protein